MCTQNELDQQISVLQELVADDLANGKHVQKRFHQILTDSGKRPNEFAAELESCSVKKVANGKG